MEIDNNAHARRVRADRLFTTSYLKRDLAEIVDRVDRAIAHAENEVAALDVASKEIGDDLSAESYTVRNLEKRMLNATKALDDLLALRAAIQPFVED